jgi:hypothetical protein
VHFTETLLLAGLAPPIATVGDALDNALAGTAIGLDKTECVPDGSPFRNGPQESLADVEQATSAWACWYNTRRSAGDRQQKPRPGTTLPAADPATQPTIFTHNRVCVFNSGCFTAIVGTGGSAPNPTRPNSPLNASA